MTLIEACAKAKTESANGYVQHVNASASGGYIVSDWCDSSTIASFENGLQISGRQIDATIVKPSQLADEHTLNSVIQVATYDRARVIGEVDFWDEGYGPLWVYRESLGVRGVVRARSWEEAYDCVIDEIMDDGDEADVSDAERESGNLPEGMHFRANGVPSNPRLKSCLAQEDLNGSYLDPLTDSLADDLGLVIYRNPDEEED